MKSHTGWMIVFLMISLMAGIIGVRCQQTNAPINLKSVEPAQPQPSTPPTPSFQEGVQFGLIARQRNQDVDDVRVLVQLAYRLWHQAWMQQQAILAQRSTATNQVSTNAQPVNTNEPATDHHTQNTNAEDPQ